MNNLIDGYFIWLCAIVTNDPTSNHDSYSKLLRYLFKRPFMYYYSADNDRAKDGLYLRSLYFQETGNELNMDLGECRLLEMMIGLARRCEADIMYNNFLGNRTGQWFWEMIASLKLGQMTDAYYDEEYVEMRISNFLNRRYKINGEGGLFTVEHIIEDMRKISIWKQMNLYLNEVLADEGVLSVI